MHGPHPCDTLLRSKSCGADQVRIANAWTRGPGASSGLASVRDPIPASAVGFIQVGGVRRQLDPRLLPPDA